MSYVLGGPCYLINSKKLKSLLKLQNGKNLKWLAEELRFSDQGKLSKMMRLPIQWEEIDKICQATGLEWHSFSKRCDPSSQQSLFFISDILDKYKALPSDHVVSIVSADGYKETDDVELFDAMCELCNRGIKVRYFYPCEPVHKNISLRHFSKLLKKYRLRFRDNADSVPQGYMISKEGTRLFGWDTRYVVVTQSVEFEEQVKDVFIYVVTKGKDEFSDGLDLWLRLRDDVGRSFYKYLVSRAEPVPSLGIYKNRIASRVQTAYRSQFAQDKFRTTYDELRDIINTWGTIEQWVQRCLDDWIVRSFSELKKGSTLRVLDIGTGDGEVLQSLIEKILQLTEHRVFLRVSAIEPAFFDLTNIGKEHGVTVESHDISLEDFDIRNGEYDIITSVHSLYLIDPVYLGKIYEMLSNNGIALLVTSPYKNNVLNLLCVASDDVLEERERKSIRPYNDKVVTADNYRVYGEDTYREAGLDHNPGHFGYIYRHGAPQKNKETSKISGSSSLQPPASSRLGGR